MARNTLFTSYITFPNPKLLIISICPSVCLPIHQPYFYQDIRIPFFYNSGPNQYRISWTDIITYHFVTDCRVIMSCNATLLQLYPGRRSRFLNGLHIAQFLQKILIHKVVMKFPGFCTATNSTTVPPSLEHMTPVHIVVTLQFKIVRYEPPVPSGVFF